MRTAFAGCLAAAVLGSFAGYMFCCSTQQQQVALERAAHSHDNEISARKLAAISAGAAKAASDAIAVHERTVSRLAALEQQFNHERASHEADNSKNRATINDGVRRLRIATADAASREHSGAAVAGSGSGNMGNGTRRYAELSPTIGAALFKIVDGADDDARAKADYLQQYIRVLQATGIVDASS